MKVGLNATCLNARPSGAKQRFEGIYGALVRRMPTVEFVVFEPRDWQASSSFAGLDNVAYRPTPIPSTGRFGKLAAAFGYWPLAFTREAFDVFEMMHLPLFRPARGKTLLTIHDIRDLYPAYATMNRLIYSNVLRRALQRADHVVTVSAAMREEILAFYPHTPVSVVYNGLDPRSFAGVAPADLDVLVAKFELPRDFVLAVGHFEPRKNFSRLIDAIALLKKRGIDCPLVIVGNDSGEGPALLGQIKALNLTRQVKLLSGLSDFEVRCIYLLCGLFVFPSLYEGFGIPLLEAMAAGRPMVSSDLPVFREITEDQGIYFPPEDVGAMADALEVGLTDSLARAHGVQYGAQRVTDFSFDRLAEGIAGIYKQLGFDV